MKNKDIVIAFMFLLAAIAFAATAWMNKEIHSHMRGQIDEIRQHVGLEPAYGAIE